MIRANGDPHNPPAPASAASATITAPAAASLSGRADVAAPRGLGDWEDDGAPSPAATAAAARPRSRRETLLVNLAIGMVFLVVIVSVSIIYIRWLIVTEPTAAVVVYGDPALDGARVYVQAEDGHSILKEPVTLDASNDFVTPVLLVPGTYTVRAVLDGKVVRESRVHVRPYEGQMFFLSEEARRRAAEGVRDERPRRAPAHPATTTKSVGTTAPAPLTRRHLYGRLVH